MTQLAIQQSDLAARLRKWGRAVGMLSPTLTEAMVADVTMANLSIDPYQNEFKTYSTGGFNGGVAAQDSVIGLNCLAPVALVYACSFTPAAAGQTINLQVSRPTPPNVGVHAGAAPFNNGGAGSPANFFPISFTINTNIAGGPSGLTIDSITVDTVRTFFWTPPFPLVLYGPGFNGNPAGSGNGDTFTITNSVAAATLRAQIYFAEYPNFQPN